MQNGICAAEVVRREGDGVAMASTKRTREAKKYCFTYDLSGGLVTDPSGAVGGELIKDQNLSTRCYPSLAPRLIYRSNRSTHKYGCLGSIGKKMISMVGTNFLVNNKYEYTVGISRYEKFVDLAGLVYVGTTGYIYYPETDSISPINDTPNSMTLMLYEGTLAGKDAGINTVKAEGHDLTKYFKVGDGVRFVGYSSLTYNGYYTVKEVNKAAKELRFRKNAFGTSGSRQITGSFERGMPTMSQLYSCGGRVWGYKGRNIYATSYGRVTNWYAYESGKDTSTSKQSPDSDDLTGICGTAGIPVFFSAKAFYTMRGESSDQFRLVCENTCIGVPEELNGSITSAGDSVIFMSSDAVVRCFDGNRIEELVSLPARKYVSAHSGFFEGKYYIVLKDEQDNGYFYVYDLDKKLLHQRDYRGFSFFTPFEGHLYVVDPISGIIAIDDRASELDEYADEASWVNSVAEFADVYPHREIPGGEQDNKYSSLKSLRVTASVGDGAYDSISVYVKLDNGPWYFLKTLPSGFSGTTDIFAAPNYCHSWRLKLEGTGDYCVKSIQAYYTR